MHEESQNNLNELRSLWLICNNFWITIMLNYFLNSFFLREKTSDSKFTFCNNKQSEYIISC